jgi:hypothetical protein
MIKTVANFIVNCEENLFTDHPKDGETIEYFRVDPETTGLGLNLFVDCCKSYKRHRHPLWVYVQRDVNVKQEGLFILTVEPQPRMLGNLPVTLTPQQINDVKQIITKNIQLFVDVANMKIEDVDFVDRVIAIELL